jgi:hypothetical protein
LNYHKEKKIKFQPNYGFCTLGLPGEFEEVKERIDNFVGKN